MSLRKCENCGKVMEIRCSGEIKSCPCCGINDVPALTDELISSDAHIYRYTHRNTDGYDGCGARYTVKTTGTVEYCPNCNGQWG